MLRRSAWTSRLRSSFSRSTPVAGSSNSFPALTALGHRGEITRIEAVAVGEQHRAFDHVAELAHVARPSVGLQECVGGRRRSEHPLPELGIERVDEVLHEERHIVDVRPQGRDDDGQHVQPEEEIGAEVVFLDFLLEIPVGGRNHPDIDADIRRAADALEALFLEESQQLRLQRGRHLADFVEEDRAAVGHLQQALSSACAHR